MTLAACRQKLLEFAEPIVVLEMRRFRKSSDRRSFIAIAVLLLFVLVALLICPNQNLAVGALVILAAFYLLAVLVFIPSHGARAIQREKESGSWDLLALTPLSSGQIADQKTLSVAIPVLVMIAVGLPTDIVAAVIAGVPFLTVVTIAFMLAMAALAVSFWSVQSSSDCGKSAIWMAYLPAASALCNYLSCGGFLVGLVMLCTPQVRAQAGRMLLAALSLQFVTGMLTVPVLRIVGFFDQAMLQESSCCRPAPGFSLMR